MKTEPFPFDPSEVAATVMDLIRHRSDYPEATEESCCRRIAEILDAEGIGARMVEAAPGRPNVQAVVEGSEAGPTIILNGHVDVVPADAGAWTPCAVRAGSRRRADLRPRRGGYEGGRGVLPVGGDRPETGRGAVPGARDPVLQCRRGTHQPRHAQVSGAGVGRRFRDRRGTDGKRRPCRSSRRVALAGPNVGQAGPCGLGNRTGERRRGHGRRRFDPEVLP